jgi:hypothetical protein
VALFESEDLYLFLLIMISNLIAKLTLPHQIDVTSLTALRIYVFSVAELHYLGLLNHRV